ncbi:STM4015 family protein [Wenjunlia tyrosinilytica]|uniref:Leucine-rich repeat domain-containing protein n=1 Tax=Wenjunlia tyrosinilytica TaxID=1544741 RepID=A0A918DZL1_9ACTN|nr:STM4015 family protein [Wenjunlia tyrosinilytica]GGO95815.1 hypothetical protein GCM10012280_53850 [Wenjunlia tyrosinilytica]
MTVNAHLEELHCLPAYDFPRRGEPDEQSTLPEPESVAWRLAVDPDGGESFEECWKRFLETVDPAGVRALVIGQWGEAGDEDCAPVIELVTAARDRLTGLVAVFLGDLVARETEISWIQQADVTPLLEAFPALEELGVRGGDGLAFPAVRHERLRTLAFESGGLPAQVVRGVAASELPALRWLEMWLGVPEYGGDWTVEDIAPLLEADRFPELRHLGLQNTEVQDELAARVAKAPVVPRLTSLSLSMGTLTDTGAEALLEGRSLTHLQLLDLHHHYLSDAMTTRLRAALEPHGVEVDLDEQEEPEEDSEGIWRYAAVTE